MARPMPCDPEPNVQNVGHLFFVTIADGRRLQGWQAYFRHQWSPAVLSYPSSEPRAAFSRAWRTSSEREMP